MRGLFLVVLFFSSHAHGAKQGEIAPLFDRHVLDGGEVSLQSLRGKVVLVNFWASWCTPCRKELPELNKIYQNDSGKSLIIIGVNLDKDLKNAKRMIEEFTLTFPVVHDPDNSIIKKYKGKTMPVSYLINRAGRIENVFHGYSEKKLLKIKQAITQVLAQD